MPGPKSNYAENRENHVNDSPVSFALRQLHGMISGPIYWIILACAITLTAMAGPYFTLERLSFPERLVYWGTTISCASVLMTFLSALAYQVTKTRNWNWLIGSVTAGAIGVLPVVGTVYLGEGIVAGFAPGWYSAVPFRALLLSVAPSLIAVTVMVNFAIRMQHPQEETGDSTTAEPPTRTPLHRKLPHHLGTTIVTVRAQDHYVEVTTPQGSAMILMRLSDAVQHLEPVNGLQVHRSWWISLDHITRTETGANGPELMMSTDVRIPVGRSYRAAFDAAYTSSGAA